MDGRTQKNAGYTDVKFDNRNKTVVFFLTFLTASLLLTGCVPGEGDQKKAGAAILKEYFADSGKKATISGLYADISRPAADMLEMTDYVKGTYRLGEDEFEFRVNVETGSIYTDERMEEFSQCVLSVEAERLGLDAADCTCYASVILKPEFTGETGNSRGQEHEVTLYDVLPVTITDMDEFVGQVLENENADVRSIIISREVPEATDAGQPDTQGWNAGEISICLMEDPDKELPSDKYDILRYWGDNRDNAIDIDF